MCEEAGKDQGSSENDERCEFEFLSHMIFT